MNDSGIIDKIAEKDFNVNAFVELAINDEKVRNEIVNQMISNPAIMAYYHCYYIVEKATRRQPELFYQYWRDIADLIHHTNSYHRDFALGILGNLLKVDEENRFSEIEDDYFAIINESCIDIDFSLFQSESLFWGGSMLKPHCSLVTWW